jgi:hypothetical protein
MRGFGGRGGGGINFNIVANGFNVNKISLLAIRVTDSFVPHEDPLPLCGECTLNYRNLVLGQVAP